MVPKKKLAPSGHPSTSKAPLPAASNATGGAETHEGANATGCLAGAGGTATIPTSEIIYNQAIIDGIVKSNAVGHEIAIEIPEI